MMQIWPSMIHYFKQQIPSSKIVVPSALLFMVARIDSDSANKENEMIITETLHADKEGKNDTNSVISNSSFHHVLNAKSETNIKSFHQSGNKLFNLPTSFIQFQISNQINAKMKMNTCQCEKENSSNPFAFFRNISKSIRNLGGRPSVYEANINKEENNPFCCNEQNKEHSISSRYEIHRNEVLGEGTFGTVYLATKKSNGERIAMKIIPKKLLQKMSSTTRGTSPFEAFDREMKTHLKIQKASTGGHPNICYLHDYFESESHYFLVLELVSGGEMFDHLIRIGAYSEADAARLVQEVASALAFLHGIGIIHGDLKPENIMLSTNRPGDAAIKIVDLGCACDVQQQKEEENKTSNQYGNQGRRPLTPAYSPPELFKMSLKHRQQKGQRITSPMHQSMDMWSLGIILYIMLTGLHPFDLTGKATDKEIALKIIRKEKPPLRNSPITAHLSPSAIDLIERLLQWDPSKRLSAFEMLQHPWVRGETARKQIMANSDKKLNMFREFKTRLEAKVFADMVHFSPDVSLKTSLIEQSFRNFDSEEKGFVTSQDLEQLGQHTTQTDSNTYSSINNRKYTGHSTKTSTKTKQSSPTSSLSLSSFSNLLSENMKNKYYNIGDIVYEEGDIGNHMYFINSGTIQVTTKDGSTAQRHRGDSFGEGALLHPQKLRSATVQCITPVHAIQISREYFEKYVANSQSPTKSNSGLTLLHLTEKDRTRKRNRAKTILRLQQNLKEMKVKNGEPLFHPGQEGNLLYIIEHGSIDIQLDGLNVFSLKPGDLCGEHSLLMNRPRNTIAKCVNKNGDDCKVHAMKAADFHILLEESSESVRKSLRELCLRREFQKAIVNKTRKDFPVVVINNGDLNLFGLKEAFDAVDEEGDGKITLKNLKALINKFDPTMSENEVQEVIESLDLLQDGSITFDEFLGIFHMNATQADSI